MKEALRPYRPDLRQSWQVALLLIALIPLFPEYIAFALVIAAGLFGWHALRKSGEKLKIGKIGKLLLVYIAYTACSVIYSRNRLSSAATAAMWLILFVVYLVCSNLLSDTARFDLFVMWMTAVAGIVGFIACCQYRIAFFTHGQTTEVWKWLDNIVYQALPIKLCHVPYVLRACSTYAHPNMLSEYLTMVAPFVVYFNFHERRKELRTFSRICLFLTFGGVIFSFSRGGYIALLVLLLALVVLNIRHRFAAVAMYIFGALLLIPEEVVERLLTILPNISGGTKIIEDVTSAPELTYTTTAGIINSASGDMGMDARWKIWLEAIHSFCQRPLFGAGAGVQTTWDMLTESGIPSGVHAHNLVLELLVEGGIIALILMLLVGFMSIKNGVELIRAGYSTAFWVGFAVLGCIMSFCLQGVVDYPLMSPKLICNFMMLVGITERAIHLYSGREIAMRRALRKRLRKKAAKPTRV